MVAQRMVGALEHNAVYQQAGKGVPAVQKAQRSNEPLRSPAGEVKCPAEGSWTCSSAAPGAHGMLSTATAPFECTAHDSCGCLRCTSYCSVDVKVTATCKDIDSPAPPHTTSMQVSPFPAN
jgi:hypothetical protein